MRYLNPKADLTFKRVFGEHPDLVMSLLNAMLPLTPDQEITEIEYLPSEMVPDNPLRKNSIVDVRCKDKQGRQFIVEMQMIWSPEFKQRVLFNASKAYVRQIGVGEHYELLQPVYSLNLVNEVFEPGMEGYYHYYRMVHEENSEKIIDGLQLIFIELPKFTPHNYSEKKMQVLWLRYLTEIDEKTRQVPEELLANPEVKKAVTALEESAFTEAQLLGYEKFWDIISVEKTLYSSAERRGLAAGIQQGMQQGIQQGMQQGLQQGMQQGLQQGIQQGMQQGIQQGLQQGIQQGMQEGIQQGIQEGLQQGRVEEQRSIAASLKRQGVAPAIIVQCTGLTLDEIATL